MNIMKMMQQAKAMQGKMADMQAAMETVIVEGVSGSGAVRVQMTCKGSCVSVAVEPSAMEDKEMMEDLIKLAINDAKGKADARLADETQKMMVELGLPPGALGNGGLPF